MAKIAAIFEEVKGAAVHVEENSNDGACSEETVLWRVLGVKLIDVIVGFPSFVPVFVTGFEVDAPDVRLSG